MYALILYFFSGNHETLIATNSLYHDTVSAEVSSDVSKTKTKIENKLHIPYSKDPLLRMENWPEIVARVLIPSLTACWNKREKIL